jgi:hypothetical protein
VSSFRTGLGSFRRSVRPSRRERALLDRIDAENEALRASGPVVTLDCSCQTVNSEPYLYCLEHGFPDPGST